MAGSSRFREGFTDAQAAWFHRTPGSRPQTGRKNFAGRIEIAVINGIIGPRMGGHDDGDRIGPGDSRRGVSSSPEPACSHIAGQDRIKPGLFKRRLNAVYLRDGRSICATGGYESTVIDQLACQRQAHFPRARNIM